VHVKELGGPPSFCAYPEVSGIAAQHRTIDTVRFLRAAASLLERLASVSVRRYNPGPRRCERTRVAIRAAWPFEYLIVFPSFAHPP